MAEVALAIADREGFEAVSMRRIAGELGAGVMSLYRYVRTKDDLVDLMDDAVMGELLVPDGELPTDWREATSVIARRTREAFLRHPWAATSLQHAVPGPNALRHSEQSLAAVATTPLGGRDKLELLGIIDDFVLGHAIRAAQFRARMGIDEDSVQAVIDLGTVELQSGRYPHTEALLADADARDVLGDLVGPEHDLARFERGLSAILDSVDGSRAGRTSPSDTAYTETGGTRS
jgi:AcrR family transcriptional regulator